MKISILGAGRVGGNLAHSLAAKGHEVTVGHRDPAAGTARWQKSQVRHASFAQAAAASPIVIHATPGDTALETLVPLSEPLTGKILLDVSNATKRLPNGMPGGLCYPDSSLAEKLQEALPETRVVKSLNTMLFTVMTAPRSLSVPPAAFTSGNDVEAKRQVQALLGELGWPPEWITDLGSIESSRATEALILIAPHIVGSKGFRPFALTVAF